MKYIVPILLLVLAGATVFFIGLPAWNKIALLRADERAYADSIGSLKELELKKSELREKYNQLSPSDLDRLEKLLPSKVDNIRFIIEIENIARQYGMSLKNVRFDAPGSAQGTRAENGAYGSFDLDFSL